jgi:hypothetical protein
MQDNLNSRQSHYCPRAYVSPLGRTQVPMLGRPAASPAKISSPLLRRSLCMLLEASSAAASRACAGLPPCTLSKYSGSFALRRSCHHKQHRLSLCRGPSLILHTLQKRVQPADPRNRYPDLFAELRRAMQLTIMVYYICRQGHRPGYQTQLCAHMRYMSHQHGRRVIN